VYSLPCLKKKKKKKKKKINNFLLGGRDADRIDLNYKKEWNILSNNQIISDDYSKTPFLVRSAALFTEIMPRAYYSTRVTIPKV